MYFRFILFISLAFCLLSIQSIAETNSELLFEKANSEYKLAKYQSAIALYDSLIKMGYEESDLFYNLGCAYFKKGELGLSKLYYEKARILNPGDQDILHSLSVVNARLIDKVEPVPQLFVIRWWNDLKESNAMTTLFYLSFIFLCLVAAAIVVYYWWDILWIRRTAFFAGIIFSLIFILNIFLLLDKSEDMSAHRMAILIENTFTAKSSPDRTGIDAFSIHEGIKIEIIDELDDWLKIRLTDGKIGWIPSYTIQRI